MRDRAGHVTSAASDDKQGKEVRAAAVVWDQSAARTLPELPPCNVSHHSLLRSKDIGPTALLQELLIPPQQWASAQRAAKHETPAFKSAKRKFPCTC